MITIRPAEPSDTDALQRLYEEFVHEADWLPEEAKKDPDFAATSAGERVTVAESAEGEIVGLMSVWERESFVHTLCVSDAWKGQGIGTRLLDSLEGWLPQPWRLKCVAANRQAVGFYRGRGWRHIETAIGKQGVYYLLEKHLSADQVSKLNQKSEV